MTCPRCKSEIADSSLVCPVCGDWCAASIQKERVDALKSKTKNIVHESYKSKLFQAMTALITIVAGITALNCFVISASSGNISFNLDLSVILYILAAVFCWQAHTSSDPKLAGHHLRRVSFFDAAYWIIMLIAACLLGLLTPFCFLFISLGDAIFEEAWAEIEPELAALVSGEELEMVTDILLNKADILFVVITFIFVVSAAVSVWLCIIHYRRRHYLKNVAESIDFEQYNVAKAPPYVSVIVYAGIGIFGSLSTFTTAMFTSGFLIVPLAQALALDGFLILSAVWMAKLHRDELANIAEIENESAVLNNLIYASKIEFEKKSNETEENQ